MTQTDAQKSKGQKTRRLMLVRYGKMGLLGWIEHNEPEIPKVPTKVVIKTSRGLELGEIAGPYCYRSGQFKSSPEQVTAYYNPSDPKEHPIVDGGSFVRFATEEDLREAEHLEASAQEEARTCMKFVREMNLPMKIIEAEHLFGGERIIVYFSSGGRVDFRDLVRRLAKEYQTRIELRQVGSRDEARLISDFESCGQECCCRRFLKILDPVNMRMAKLQKATLDPSKISGHCGRLKCCLRYEDEIYKILKDQLPRKNSWVQTPKGPGRIFDTQLLTQQVVVQLDENDREIFSVKDVSPLSGPPEGVTWHLYRPPVPGQPPQQQGRPGDRGRSSGQQNRPGQNQRRDRRDHPPRHEGRRNGRNDYGPQPPSAMDSDVAPEEPNSLAMPADDASQGPLQPEVSDTIEPVENEDDLRQDNPDVLDDDSEPTQDKDQP